MRVLQVENEIFTPSLYSINGGIGREEPIRYSVTEMMLEKHDKHYSTTMSWI